MDAALFGQVAGRFATGVAVVTAVADGTDHAAAVRAFTSVSLDPPLVMFCVERGAPFHGAVPLGGRWAVSVLAEDMRATAEELASRRPGPVPDGWPGGLEHRRGAATGAAILTGALAVLECLTHAVHDAGDHAIVVGEVVALDAPDVQGGPLIVHAGRYRTLG